MRKTHRKCFDKFTKKPAYSGFFRFLCVYLRYIFVFKMLKKLIIAIDFDGTCVTHEFPNVGKDIGAVRVLKALIDSGHKLMLWTMRSQKQPAQLQDAVNWFESNGLPIIGVNQNPDQHWSSSPKQYAQLYIDDAALGCPLKFHVSISERPFVDWEKVEEILTESGVITYTKDIL